MESFGGPYRDLPDSSLAAASEFGYQLLKGFGPSARVSPESSIQQGRKRLEQGRFTWPASENGQVSLRGEEFSALIHGLEVRSKKNWYRR